MKLQMLTIDEYDGEVIEEYKDIYLYENLISGWYLPNQEDFNKTTVNLRWDGEWITVILTNELRKYLDRNLTNPEKYEIK